MKKKILQGILLPKDEIENSPSCQVTTLHQVEFKRIIIIVVILLRRVHRPLEDSEEIWWQLEHRHPNRLRFRLRQPLLTLEADPFLPIHLYRYPIKRREDQDEDLRLEM